MTSALKLHYGLKQPRIPTKVLGHLLFCLLVCSNRSYICLFRTTHYGHALHCAHRSLTHLLTPKLVGNWMIGCLNIKLFRTIVHCSYEKNVYSSLHSIVHICVDMDTGRIYFANCPDITKNARLSFFDFVNLRCRQRCVEICSDRKLANWNWLLFRS